VHASLQNRGPNRPTGLPAWDRHRPYFSCLTQAKQARPGLQTGQAGCLK